MAPNAPTRCRQGEEQQMTVNESKGLKKGARVYCRGDAADSGIIHETSWDAVTITWTMGRWPACTTGTCAKFTERQQSRVKGRRNIVRSNLFGQLNREKRYDDFFEGTESR
jgi:hypothetical protein